MGNYREVFSRLQSGVLTGSAMLSLEAREEIKAHVLRGADLHPNILKNWIDKVSSASYKTLDREIDELIESGYSEQMIFEATATVSLVAAEKILKKGLDLL